MNQTYLGLLGVTQWRLRETRVFSYYRVAFYGANQEIVGWLLADAILENEAENELVNAIVKATKIVAKGEKVSDVPFEEAGALILLGEGVSRRWRREKSVSSYSPAELLANEKLKAQTWQEVKKAMAWMNQK